MMMTVDAESYVQNLDEIRWNIALLGETGWRENASDAQNWRLRLIFHFYDKATCNHISETFTFSRSLEYFHEKMKIWA